MRKVIIVDSGETFDSDGSTAKELGATYWRPGFVPPSNVRGHLVAKSEKTLLVRIDRNEVSKGMRNPGRWFTESEIEDFLDSGSMYVDIVIGRAGVQYVKEVPLLDERLFEI
jgi:hypothetical protein